MNNEDQAILDEITEELKHDQFVKFVKRNQNTITAVILCGIAGIVMYTSWQSRVKKELEDTTFSLMEVMISNNNKADIILGSIEENAPASIKPIINIIKAGMTVRLEQDAEKRKAALSGLLSVVEKNGVDIIWKDLAALVYVTNAKMMLVDAKELIKMLEPIVALGRPLRLSALECLGALYLETGDILKAKSCFNEIQKDKNATENMKKRVRLYLSSLSR